MFVFKKRIDLKARPLQMSCSANTNQISQSLHHGQSVPGLSLYHYCIVRSQVTTGPYRTGLEKVFETTAFLLNGK